VPGAQDARGRGRLRRARRAGLTLTLADDLRAVLLDPRDAVGLEVHGRTDAAVLVPLYVDSEGDVHAVFTKRRHDMRRHPGEISVPGGRRDDTDSELWQTALRETHEEIGLPPEHVEIIGALQPTPTLVTNFAIYPFVGMIEPGFEWIIEAAEVDIVLEFKLRDLRDGYARRRMIRRGLPFRTDSYEVGDHIIWGATARMVADLLERADALI
jgi:8-oxo-dGTP pyrophosphatase MutT (NUDIX family)